MSTRSRTPREARRVGPRPPKRKPLMRTWTSLAKTVCREGVTGALRYVAEEDWEMAQELRSDTIRQVPAGVASRRAGAWAEALEALGDGEASWEKPARYRARLLLAPVPWGLDRIAEIKARLAKWERATSAS